ncbi:hypothetical protein MPTK1_3g12990 [Marchantia polymorpha subsp. ruderalis]|uniref:Uncharacterized protein n=2 Tax=Marchantia polymorpha TaxID=3197 RepID=A0AAF6B090_MARPO|nr:hypothetical protein MARPO_0050s0091 [Marchantia polymorpha]BBN05424.1 hypothetical protein Mp_3g12990 [Marchantia polymorpha subsp. ruderalis]|eukprot:PTQ38637.1 hypothetical protein MARPO_0050s0091 [Marchantia polymorpha]
MIKSDPRPPLPTSLTPFPPCKYHHCTTPHPPPLMNMARPSRYEGEGGQPEHTTPEGRQAPSKIQIGRLEARNGVSQE